MKKVDRSFRRSFSNLPRWQKCLIASAVCIGVLDVILVAIPDEEISPLQDMVQVTGGTFEMGNPAAMAEGNEVPVHSVTISSFHIDKTEITYEKWTDVRNWALTHGYTDLPVGRNGYNGTANHPVTDVGWYAAIKWCNARSERDGLTPVYYTTFGRTTLCRRGPPPPFGLDIDSVNWTANGYRLPTEAEWEFAARGGTKSKGYTYSGSDRLDTVAWYAQNSGNNTHPVGTKQANELDIYDMSGNVWEWCWDWFEDYRPEALTDPKGESSGPNHVIRGGSFDIDSNYSRVAWRTVGEHPSDHGGFRCVRSVQTENQGQLVSQQFSEQSGISAPALTDSSVDDILFPRLKYGMSYDRVITLGNDYENGAAERAEGVIYEYSIHRRILDAMVEVSIWFGNDGLLDVGVVFEDCNSKITQQGKIVLPSGCRDVVDKFARHYDERFGEHTIEIREDEQGLAKNSPAYDCNWVSSSSKVTLFTSSSLSGVGYERK